MAIKDDFEFINSDVWLKYTQDRYVPLEDIKYRLEKLNISKSDWPDLKLKILAFRKLNSIPLFLESISKKFWFFPSDCILKKINHIEHVGNKLFEKIENYQSFKEEFLTNSSIEEAITSAIYEGANSTRAAAKELIATEKVPATKDEWMLINNFRAMQWIKENHLSDVDKKLILVIHKMVTKNTLLGDDANFSGKFRDDKVFVGSHEGVNFNLIESTLDEVITLTTSNPRYLHGLVKGILLHYFIGYIHPFFDGNGRTARTLFYYKAMKNDLKFVELLSISAYLKEHGNQYTKAFDLVKENEMDITYFVDFCLDSLIESLNKVEEKVAYLMDIAILKEPFKLSSTQITFLQKISLNKEKVITIEAYAAAINKSREIARKELSDLAKKGFLKETKVSRKYTYKLLPPILKERIIKYKV
ncbi:MAG: Fic family protein [Bacteriovoracia bacterium]